MSSQPPKSPPEVNEAAHRPQRRERDTMGELSVPHTALWGAGTQRAVDNFPLGGPRFPRRFIHALGLVKGAAAETNADLGLIPREIADAIAAAAREAADGNLDDHFVLDIFQTGSGTSTNMNANEVIANRAIQMLGGELGSKRPVHPNDHVNLGQSSNDVIPTALHIAGLTAIRDALLPALRTLHAALLAKSKEFHHIIKTGRTHLQDATPIRLGQEFEGYAGQIERVDRARRGRARRTLGGRARRNCGRDRHQHPSRVRPACDARLSAPSRHAHPRDEQPLSGAEHARQRGRGQRRDARHRRLDVQDRQRHPLARFRPARRHRRIGVPEVQPGSSIMPGKVNPVIAESIMMVCAQVIGNDATIAFGGAAGNFEINLMMPVVAYNLIRAIELLAAAAAQLRATVHRGIARDGARPRERAPRSDDRDGPRSGRRIRCGGGDREGGRQDR